MKRIFATTVVFAIALAAIPFSALAKGDDFGAVVKTIEQFYHVKHKSIPLLARAGMKATTTAARIRGGEARKLAEAGSVKAVFFEDQEFNSHGELVNFRNAMRSALADWNPFIQTTSPKAEEQTHIFLKEAGEKFNVLVVTIEKHEAVVVQMTLAPKTLAQLMKDPEGMGKAITDDARKDDQE